MACKVARRSLCGIALYLSVPKHAPEYPYFIIFLLHKQLTELPIFPRGFRVFCYGNTTQSLCVRCVVRFFGRLPRNSAGILPYGKGFLGNMTENLHADCVQSRQAGFVRCCLKSGFMQCFLYFGSGKYRRGSISSRVQELLRSSTNFVSENSE